MDAECRGALHRATGEWPFGSTGTFTLNAVSTAQFGGANVTAASSAERDTSQRARRAAATPGGVTINLSGDTTGGTFTVQQIPNSGGLSQQAIAAAQVNPTFALSTSTLSADPQIWNVEYTGLPTGQTATLVFHYDPSLLPAGTDQSQLGIWHFDKTANAWEFGGTVNTTDHTITFVTSSFSPFELGRCARALDPGPAGLGFLGSGRVSAATCRELNSLQLNVRYAIERPLPAGGGLSFCTPPHVEGREMSPAHARGSAGVPRRLCPSLPRELGMEAPPASASYLTERKVRSTLEVCLEECIANDTSASNCVVLLAAAD